MVVTLKPEIEEIISKQIESGRFQSATEVVTTGLRLLTQNEVWNEGVLESKLLQDLDSGDASEMSDAEWDMIGRRRR